MFEATNRTYRPGIYDDKNNKWRNRNDAEFHEYKSNNASNHGSSASGSAPRGKKLPVVGPGWQLKNPKITYGPDAPDMSLDFRAVLQKKWDAVLNKKGWVLGEEWKKEAADDISSFDQALEVVESQTTVFE